MKFKPFLPLVAAVLVAGGVSTADAAPVHFAITGGYTASFDIDSAALPDYFSSTSINFNNVGGTFAGTRFGSSVPATATAASLVQFFSASFGGGIAINANGLNRFVEDGAQLYSGATSAPNFLPGQYVLKADVADGYAAAVLTITQTATAAVPEPANWAMMMLGFGAIGGVLRRRNIRTTASYA